MRRILLLLLTFIFYTTSWAQRTVTGKVVDEVGNVLPGVSVTVKGSSIGTATKSDGTFTLPVPASGRTLTFTYSGRKPEEVTIGSQTNFNIALSPTTSSLQEVVVVDMEHKTGERLLLPFQKLVAMILLISPW
jgi:iron complex outermembrane receptor protein